MARFLSTAADLRRFSVRFPDLGPVFLAVVLIFVSLGAARSQSVDCAGLRAKIGALDAQSAARPNRYAGAARKQRAELDRTLAYSHSLGCDQPEIPIFGPPRPPRCRGLESKIAQMQANLGQLEAAATSDTDRARQDLMARYDAYCRAPIQAHQQNAPQNFFEALFGAFAPSQPAQPVPPPWPPQQPESPDDEPDTGPRGGSQAVCVRTCDGGFFPLHVSARHADATYLGDLCRALCPNTDARVFTKGPYSEIKTAVSLDDDTPYSDLPNASKFQSSHDAACTCKPANQSWVEALVGAEQILGEGRRGDIVVTPETSAQLSQAQPIPRAKAAGRSHPDSAGATAKAAETAASPTAPTTPERAPNAAAASTRAPVPDETKEIVGPDGVRRRVRIIAPML
jgi:hypothetical protein